MIEFMDQALPMQPLPGGDSLLFPPEGGRAFSPHGEINRANPFADRASDEGDTAVTFDDIFVDKESAAQEETTIVVYGMRIDYAGVGGSTFYRGSDEGTGLEPHPTLSPGGGAPDEPDDYDPPKVAAELLDPANEKKVTDAAREMIDEVNRLTPLINNLPNDARVTLADGTEMTGAEVKELWRTIDFVVTDRTFGPGRSGAYDSATGISTINAFDALGWDAHTNGLAFIILHEVMHHSDAGQIVEQTQWDNAGHPETNYYLTAEFAENEEFANFGALELARRFQLDPSGPFFFPEHGYEYGDLSR